MPAFVFDHWLGGFIVLIKRYARFITQQNLIQNLQEQTEESFADSHSRFPGNVACPFVTPAEPEWGAATVPAQRRMPMVNVTCRQ